MKKLGDLDIFCNDLNRMIAEYDSKPWNPTVSSHFSQLGSPTGILSYEKTIYICNYEPSVVLSHNTINNLKLNEKYISYGYPWSIDINESKKELYLLSKSKITKLNLKLDILSSHDIPIPYSSHGSFRSIKIDQKIFYITVEGIPYIFLCDLQDCKLVNKWNAIDKKPEAKKRKKIEKEEPWSPYGITVDNKYLYVCDWSNHYIQILDKEKDGKWSHQWGNGEESKDYGQFSFPYTIYYYPFDDIFYVGDVCSVTLYTKENICIQRIGENQFSFILGLCVIDNCLYVSDNDNKRILIFKRKS